MVKYCTIYSTTFVHSFNDSNILLCPTLYLLSQFYIVIVLHYIRALKLTNKLP